METDVRGDAFGVLRRALRARGMNYADLGRALTLSEPTIKRIFASGDCKFSRLVEICNVLEVSVGDVVGRAERTGDDPRYLPVKVEAALAGNPSLFYVYILLRDARSEVAIKQWFNLDDQDMFLFGRMLERLDLAELRVDGTIRVLLDQPVLFRRGGPLNKLIKDLNLNFIAGAIDCVGDEGQIFDTISRQMSADTARQIGQEIQNLHERIANLARQDQLLSRPDELATFKFCVAWGEAQFSELVKIEKPQHVAPQKQ